MAGNSFHRLWTWISIVVLPTGCLLSSTSEQPPCGSYLSDGIENDSYLFNRSSSETAEEVMVFLRDRCDTTETIDATDIQEYFDRSNLDLQITVIPLSLSCETKTWGLDALLRLLGQRRTKALIAALDSPMCEVTVKLAHLWNIPLLTWTCPLKDSEEGELSSSIVRLSPSLPTIAKALAEMMMRLQWKTVAVIGTDREPWTSLERALYNFLQSMGAVIRHRVTLPHQATFEQIRKTIRAMYNVSHRVTVLCLPASDGNDLMIRVLTELDVAQQSSNFSSNSITVIVHTEDDGLFLPNNTFGDTLISRFDSPTSVPFPPVSSFNSSNSSAFGNVSDRDSPENSYETNTSDEVAEGGEGEGEGEGEGKARFFPPKNLSSTFLERLLTIIPLDHRYDAERVYQGVDRYVIPTLMDRLNETLNILIYDNSSINAFNNKIYTYVLLDWRINGWRPVMITVERRGKLFVRKLSTNVIAFRDANDNLLTLRKCNNVEVVNGNGNGNGIRDGDGDIIDCMEDTSNGSSAFRIAHVVTIILGSIVLTVLAILLVILIRKRLLKNRMSRGPYKIILTTSDFVFPQVPRVDSRRVDEGIEAMLCCWLQQLQEFGGPEVEKPDLLQLGSVSSLKPCLRASTGNLARPNFFKEPCARYNGDLVQLKELPTQGTFELKGKAMEVLVTIHGLRHENLNPLIGCLNEPARPCLVYEYCSRGSLEDVLVQDEIKLDWSFRLSLLTDLVRGMRYLHGTPVRVHGYLTSRNCVIDARWVLKVTDYGLPTFYEAQNIVPPTKMARDLLWTAPELLRQPNLRKRGTQAGDVYSFGIIMQEVVVRGEPFCMLALSPEDIIEKVMKPPPLIRPSVSKGAAPPEAINIMRQCWAEAADMRPDFDDVHDLFKKLNHGRKVNFVDTMFQMLEKYSNNLEELIRERTEQLDMEKKKTEQLLNRMLPSSVAEKLKLGMPVDPEEFREVTIYFSDIVGFTTISAHSTPFQVVDLLNDLYTCFDATINAYTVYKVETIGDAYMVVAGCPVRIPDHASQIATMALDLLHQSGKFKLRHLPRTQLRLRIGLHTGPCCAGVVGLTMPRYCLFGDTVNTASRMESTGAPWRIHLSQATRDRLTRDGGYQIEYRGRTEVKGKGKMPTYWLLGKQGFDKELPKPPPLGENHGLNESLLLENLTKEESIVSADDNHSQLRLSREQTKCQVEREGNMNVEDGNRETGEGSEACTVAVVSVHDHHLPDSKTIADFDSQLLSSKKKPNEKEEEKNDSVNPTTVTKTTSGDDQPPPLGTSGGVFYAEAAVLGASTTSLTSISSSTTVPYRPAPARHRRIPGYIEENDLSTPYNHYRCLSPNEHYGRATGYRFLKRQFSLDRPDDTPFTEQTANHHHLQHQQSLQQQNLNTTPRLYKQNSAGAANDLERIEEVPSTPGPLLQHYRQAASVSLSVESLTLR
ncbi:Retinal guanylyl cyclase 2 [Anthophora quadrimaculata]